MAGCAGDAGAAPMAAAFACGGAALWFGVAAGDAAVAGEEAATEGASACAVFARCGAPASRASRAATLTLATSEAGETIGAPFVGAALTPGMART
jgi:hypothetical protein